MIVKPAAEDLREAAAVALLREAAEIADESTREARSGTGWTLRAVAACFVVPPMLILAYRQASEGAPILRALLPLAIAVAGFWLFVRPMLARHRQSISDRRERLEAWEEVAERRADLFRPEPAAIEGHQP